MTSFLLKLTALLLATTLAGAASTDWFVLSNKDLPDFDLPNGATASNITFESVDACADAALATNSYIAVWSSDTSTCTLKQHTTPQPATEVFLGHTPSTPPFLGYYDLPGGTGAFTTKMAHMNYFKGREWSAFQAWSSECDVWSYTLSERM
ncbi:hypothetical protein BCR44DRAFT_79646 [Catenaria anguillulae PL171]|uniref:Uncharacterized protein n=1 Tax=Catenaria anguillulae PL171 TaxID=765915 RepID=A0A1Y2HM10_9FUNG|nr:hypothetical protein BCR44DRAFT_79646 [Catenaria anguillulae PL171]